jgi:hypothetical protein
MITKSKLVITVLAILLVTVLVFMSIATMAQTITQVILNLLNGQQYFGAPHIYQGDHNGALTSQWPVYYGPSKAGLWYWGSTSINQPVLELVMLHEDSAGAMFWQEYYSGGVIRITIIGTYTAHGWAPVGHGFVIYLFLKPTMWSISPQYNYSIPYVICAICNSLPVSSDVMLPQNPTPYIVVQWDPQWQYSLITISSATGQWNVWIVTNPEGDNPSVGPSPSPNLGSYFVGWDGFGMSHFQPNPGDRINITVIYNPSTNTLTGVAYDMSTGQSASFTLNLGNYFTPPTSGNYVFGVGASTGSLGDANWALLYVAVTQQSPLSLIPTVTVQPLASIMYLITHPWVIIAIILIIVIIIALIAASISRRHRRRYRYYYRY